MSHNIFMNELHISTTPVFVQGPTAAGAGALTIMQLTALFAFSSIHQLKFDVYHEARQTSQLFSCCCSSCQIIANIYNRQSRILKQF